MGRRAADGDRIDVVGGLGLDADRVGLDRLLGRAVVGHLRRRIGPDAVDRDAETGTQFFTIGTCNPEIADGGVLLGANREGSDRAACAGKSRTVGLRHAAARHVAKLGIHLALHFIDARSTGKPKRPLRDACGNDERANLIVAAGGHVHLGRARFCGARSRALNRQVGHGDIGSGTRLATGNRIRDGAG